MTIIDILWGKYADKALPEGTPPDLVQAQREAWYIGLTSGCLAAEIGIESGPEGLAKFERFRAEVIAYGERWKLMEYT